MAPQPRVPPREPLASGDAESDPPSAVAIVSQTRANTVSERIFRVFSRVEQAGRPAPDTVGFCVISAYTDYPALS